LIVVPDCSASPDRLVVIMLLTQSPALITLMGRVTLYSSARVVHLRIRTRTSERARNRARATSHPVPCSGKHPPESPEGSPGEHNTSQKLGLLSSDQELDCA
jgi:hypothetical protein